MALLPILSLGDFYFTGFEEPESVTFGKEQSSYKHVLIGGGHVIDLLGAGDTDITWSGYFTGFQAEYRARYIEGLVKAGKPLLLKTSSFIKQVVITRFTYGYHKVFPISYTITVQVIQDQTLPVNFIIPGDITDTVLNALIQIQDIAILLNNPSITSTLALAFIAAQAAAPLTGASNVAIAAALSTAQAAQAAIGAAAGVINGNLFPSKSGLQQPETVVFPDYAGLSDELNQLTKLNTMSDLMSSYVINNYLLIGQAPQTKLVQVYRPNLYRLAVQFYGDANLWTVIASANKLMDPLPDEDVIELTIPPQPSTSTGGVLSPPAPLS